MSDAEAARNGPKSRSGMARVSLRNLSFPEEGRIELIGYGRIPTDLLTRFPSGTLAELVAAWNADARKRKVPLITDEQLQAMFEDAEAEMLH